MDRAPTAASGQGDGRLPALTDRSRRCERPTLRTAQLATLGLVAWDAPGGIDSVNAAPKRKAVTALDPDDAETAMRVNFYDGSKASAVEVSDGIIAALDTDTFEHYIPDIEAVVDFKNSDTDTYIPALRK